MVASGCEGDSSDAAVGSGSAYNSSVEEQQQQQRMPCMPFALPEPASMVPSEAAEFEVSTWVVRGHI
jgi:hypothetical protein